MQTTTANRVAAVLQAIGRASDAQSTPIDDVRVDHRRTDISMAEQFLDRSNVVPVLEQMGCKGMALMPRAA